MASGQTQSRINHGAPAPGLPSLAGLNILILNKICKRNNPKTRTLSFDFEFNRRHQNNIQGT